jgi:hypothetical protein
MAVATSRAIIISPTTATSMPIRNGTRCVSANCKPAALRSVPSADGQRSRRPNHVNIVAAVSISPTYSIADHIRVLLDDSRRSSLSNGRRRSLQGDLSLSTA